MESSYIMIEASDSYFFKKRTGKFVETGAPSIFINDDEVEFKVIYVYLAKSKKIRKYTISEAEKLKLIKIDTGSFQMGEDKYSKAITIKNKNVKLCLSTKVAIT